MKNPILNPEFRVKSHDSILKKVNDYVFQTTTDEEVTFINLIYDHGNHDMLHDVLSTNAVHFIFPTDTDIIIETKNAKKQLVCKADCTSVFINKQSHNEQYQIKLELEQELTIMSFPHNYMLSQLDGSDENPEMFLNNQLTSIFYFENCSQDERIPELIMKIKWLWNTMRADHPLVNSSIKELQNVFFQQNSIVTLLYTLSEVEIEKISQIPEIILSQPNVIHSLKNLAKQIDISVGKLELGTQIIFKSPISNLIQRIQLKGLANEKLILNQHFNLPRYNDNYTVSTIFNNMFRSRSTVKAS